MKQLKKTLLTLVALLAVTTGAWATDTYTVTFAANGNTKTVENVTLPKNFQCSYSNADGELDLILKELYGWTGDSGETVCANWSTPTSSDANKVVAGKDNDGHYITIDNVFEGTVTITGDYYVNYSLTSYTLEISIAAVPVTAVDIAWDKAAKTGQFTMPGGNVTLEPEYYPQAALTAAPTAINDVPATTDGAIVNAGTVANIGETETAQGTVMYYVSPTQLDDAALLALAADQWTADVPTAADLAQGQAYVYYYVRGNDSNNDDENFSDGDILALTVTLAAEPTYAVTFAKGTPETDKWKAEPAAGVTKGQTVTVTYNGSKKVIGVKAEKKAAGPTTITVTWNGADITGTGGGKSFTKDDVTITADDIEFMDKNFIGGGTFTTTLGNFTKIEVTTDGWYASGTGWSGSTWTGNASSVSFSGEIMGYGGGNLKFVFTIEPTN